MSHKLPWLRLYTEARTDNKLRCLSDQQFRIWFNLLCYAADQNERGTILYDDEDCLAIEVANGDTDTMNATIQRLSKLRMVSILDDSLVFIHFIERNYYHPSDAPDRVRARVKRHRATSNEESGVTEPVKPTCNDTVTTCNDQEKRRVEKSREEHTCAFADAPALTLLPAEDAIDPDAYTPDYETFYATYPRRIRKREGFTAWQRLLKAKKHPLIADLHAASRNYSLECECQERLPEKIMHPSSFLSVQGRRYEDYLPGAVAPLINRNTSAPPPAPARYIPTAAELAETEEQARYDREQGERFRAHRAAMLGQGGGNVVV